VLERAMGRLEEAKSSQKTQRTAIEGLAGARKKEGGLEERDQALKPEIRWDMFHAQLGEDFVQAGRKGRRWLQKEETAPQS